TRARRQHATITTAGFARPALVIGGHMYRLQVRSGLAGGAKGIRTAGPQLARRNRQPSGLALCHIRIIPGRVGTIVPGLPGAGLRAVAGMVAVIAGAGIVAGRVAVIARAGIVAVISTVWIVVVIPVVG